MKKTNLYSSFAVLFVMAAITPQTVWSKDCDFKNRMPASEQINCLKEEKDKLEKDIKKLIDDKEKIVKELDEVKAKKVPEEKVVEEKELKKEKEKKDKKIAADNEVYDLMFDMTSLLMSQQQQQTMMMNQMFSMMSMAMQNFSYPQQQPQQQYDSLFPFGQFGTLAGFNPYSLESLGSSFGTHQVKWNPYSLEGVGGIGIGRQFSSHKSIYEDNFVKTPYRYPAEQPAQLERQQFIIQPPIHGYDFGQNPSTQMESVPQQLEQQKIPQLKKSNYI